MAHEIGHLLLNSPQHTASGIMQPGWGPHQTRQALTGLLSFTREQASRIRAQATLLAEAALATSTPRVGR
jgi:hypothetical protein